MSVASADRRSSGAAAAEPGSLPRSPSRLALFGAGALLAVAALIALGTWQVHRLHWKRDLIARVEARVYAAPSPAPPPATWPQVDAYRHVEVRGRFTGAPQTRVKAVTALGGGSWLLAPFRTDTGFTVLVNRGFVPDETAGSTPRLRPRPAGESVVTGLLRITEPGGAFLRRNDPAAGRWYSRDVAAIAAARGLGPVAPYFIDEDGSPGATGDPVAGLTVVHFPNNHLVYALTWFTLAAGLAGAAVWVARDEFRARRLAR